MKKINSRLKIYQIIIVLESGIKLKLARLLVVLKKLSPIGTIAQTEPKFDLIVVGKFKNDVKILFQSKKDDKEISKKIMSAGEINIH